MRQNKLIDAHAKRISKNHPAMDWALVRKHPQGKQITVLKTFTTVIFMFHMEGTTSNRNGIICYLATRHKKQNP
jgi:hypothetical protein